MVILSILSLLVIVIRSYLDKKISLHLNKGRKVSGTLRGYDQFMNIVLGDAVEDISGGDKTNDIGMVVSWGCIWLRDFPVLKFYIDILCQLNDNS